MRLRVFNILRSQNLALKYHTDSLLEVESGSNAPMSYMLTTVAIAFLSGESVLVPLLLAQQIIIGVFWRDFDGVSGGKAASSAASSFAAKPYHFPTGGYVPCLYHSGTAKWKWLSEYVFMRNLDWKLQSS